MKLPNRSVYISPNKLSEVIPLLGEALLLYDIVALDIMLMGIFDVLIKHIDIATMDELISSKSIRFVYQESIPVIGDEKEKQILLLSFPDSKTGIIDLSEIENTLTKVYPKSLVYKILDSFTAIKIDSDLFLENCRLDLQNTNYTKEIFKYTQYELGLPNFKHFVDNNGRCVFEAESKNLKLIKHVNESASYGLHLIADINYKMSLFNYFDDISNEKEIEKFIVKKLQRYFKPYTHKANSNNLMELCEINDFPDIKELLSSGLFNIKDITKLRKGDGQIFRIWLSSVTKTCSNENITFSKECAKIITKANNGLPLPTKTLVFGFLQALSLIVSPAQSIMISAANEFVIPRLLDKWQPKYFFDRARKLYLKKIN